MKPFDSEYKIFGLPNALSVSYIQLFDFALLYYIPRIYLLKEKLSMFYNFEIYGKSLLFFTIYKKSICNS